MRSHLSMANFQQSSDSFESLHSIILEFTTETETRTQSMTAFSEYTLYALCYDVSMTCSSVDIVTLYFSYSDLITISFVKLHWASRVSLISLGLFIFSFISVLEQQSQTSELSITTYSM